MGTVNGDVTSIEVKGIKIDELEDVTQERLKLLANTPGFDNSVIVMPDVHIGKVAVVGFTMKLGNKVIPNVIGVDIGCGMLAYKLENFSEDILDESSQSGFDHELIEERIRAKIPMGWGQDGLKAPNRDYYHVVNEYPWDEATAELQAFAEQSDKAYANEIQAFLNNGGYDKEYFMELANGRAGTMSTYFDDRTAISSVGTLGSGNHFIELAVGSQSGDIWVVVHSGSRGLGQNTAKYHQKHAIELRDDRTDEAREKLTELTDKYDESYVKFDVETVSDEALLDWLQGGMGEDFIDFDALKRDFTGEDRHRIEEVQREFKEAIPSADKPSLDTSLDYLEGAEAAQYLIDMVFCQVYAKENRRVMGEAVASVTGADITDRIHAVHNFIDFRDQVIRKGATRAYEGERAVIPFNMRDGTLLVEGKSNESWNKSMCHGSGRAMSPRQAEEKTTAEELAADLEANNVYAGALPVGEAPVSYKEPAFIESRIGETADVIEQLKPIHNFKAND